MSQAEELPWCPDCNQITAPSGCNTCGRCGADIVYRERV